MLFRKVLSPIGGKQISQEYFNCGGQLQEQYNNRNESEVSGLVMGLESTQFWKLSLERRKLESWCSVVSSISCSAWCT
jgi:hypothetical protein